MCRWIAYRGETTPLEQYVTAPSHSLVVQSLRALESTASTNGDGFGMGWYGEHSFAFRYAANDNANTLYYRESGQNVVIVSEPLDQERGHWRPVPPGHKLVARYGQPAQLESVDIALRVAAK